MRVHRLLKAGYCVTLAALTLAELHGCSGPQLTPVHSAERASVEHPSGPADGAALVTTDSLLAEMADLGRLTLLPMPSYITRQSSSYDRASTRPADLKTWFANDDWAQFLRTEQKNGRQEHVMLDVSGPGAIVRIWSADPKGILRVYLDGHDQPVIEEPMKQLLDGDVAGFPAPIAGQRARGHNLFFPIAYERHAKITTDNSDTYYHINYRTFTAGTLVRTFAVEEVKRLRATVESVAGLLASPRKSGAPTGSLKQVPLDVIIPGGGRKVLSTMHGASAIRDFIVSVVANDVPAACRSLILEMRFDGEPAVEVPLGDFFGTAPGPAPFESLPMGVTNQNPPRFWCHWWMPFHREAVVSVNNLGQQDGRLQGELTHSPYNWTDRSLHFHAKWRIERDLPTRPFTDWTHLACHGNGRFVGGMLHIVNYARPWWGEGDEKIYVDGEPFPSHFGTGSEDYYGYAWCSDERFTHAYHNQTRCDGPWNYGDTSINRWHIMDDIPFTRSFRFDMENWASHEKSKTTRAATSYWYARPGGTDAFKPITAADVALIHAPPYRVLRVPGALEGENLKIVSHTGIAERQPLGDQEEFSCEFHLWWHEASPGDKLVVAFEHEGEREKHVIVGLTRAADYAQVRLSVNDQIAGEVLDLYNPEISPTGPIDLGSFHLHNGTNQFSVEIVGANPAAIKNHMFGLDYIVLK